MSSKNSLVTTTDKFVKEGINDMGTKFTVVKESITPINAKNNIDTFNKTQKPQASKRKKDKYTSNKPDKGKSLDKSRSTQRTETEDILKAVNKSRSISSASVFEKTTKK